ncbi:MAG: hypothetical protein WBI05_14875 [Rhodoferax sp.]|uniref:hypothetical protein n=1 Tax=Rhodoferax sp. TaxID=50421 RepID=UPI003C7559EB|nr:hypothetical protein [Rhodoferax sp.]
MKSVQFTEKELAQAICDSSYLLNEKYPLGRQNATNNGGNDMADETQSTQPQTSEYTYGSHTFTSQEAADLFAKSRGTKQRTNMPLSQPAQKVSDRVRLFTGIVVFFVLVMAVSLLTPKSAKQSAHQAIEPDSTQSATRTNLPDNITNVLATMINFHGELCATVTSVTALGNNVYQVNCTRYRDGTGSASYDVNAATGAVK